MSSAQYVGIGLVMAPALALLVRYWIRDRPDEPDALNPAEAPRRRRRLTSGGWLSVYADSVGPRRSRKQTGPLS